MPTPELPSGFVNDGTVGSELSATKLESPFATTLPLGASISSTFTRTVAVGEEESAQTPRATPECPARVTPSVSSGAGNGVVTGFGIGVKVATPPAGWL